MSNQFKGRSAEHSFRGCLSFNVLVTNDSGYQVISLRVKFHGGYTNTLQAISQEYKVPAVLPTRTTARH